MNISSWQTRHSTPLQRRCTATWLSGWVACLVVLVIGSLPGVVCGQQRLQPGKGLKLDSQKPEASQNIGVDPKQGNLIPFDLDFRDTEQRRVEIGTYFDGQRPVMLSFNYSNCPKLCSVQLENMTDTLKEIADQWKVGRDFQVISLSIDPNEQVSRARESRAKYIERYEHSDTEEGWHFLVGKRANIGKLADACGFRYRYITRQKYYSHPPVFILLSPDGKIVRYIHGLKYEPEVMREAFSMAAKGTVGAPINIENYGFLGCFVFDESTGAYSLQMLGIMRLGGILTIAILVFTLIPYWFFNKGSAKEGLPLPSGAAGTKTGQAT